MTFTEVGFTAKASETEKRAATSRCNDGNGSVGAYFPDDPETVPVFRLPGTAMSRAIAVREGPESFRVFASTELQEKTLDGMRARFG